MSTRWNAAPARQAILRRVARAAPRPPERLLPALLDVAAAVGGTGPSLLPPSVRRALVVVPHPDDEAIGAGGLIALLAARGTDVTALLVTDGEATIGTRRSPAETGRRRRAEFVRSVEVLGARVQGTLALPDGDVAAHRDRLITQVHAALSAVRPDLVLAPWPLEAHADHRAVAEATAEALLLAGWSSGIATQPHLWTYEAHTPIVTPSHVIDITDHVAAKRSALEQHVTAARAFDLMACLGLARWRSLATRAGRGAAEAFLELDPDEVLALAAHAREVARRAPAVEVVA
jgi:LmbE family N-acetylglucosaminyl deacetylase